MPLSRSILNCVLACSALLFATFARAQGTEPRLSVDITHTPIEQLLNTSITSVSKTEEMFFGSPAAVYVLTNDAIRRSGAMSIPEALRLVPGVQVARIDANKWAVTIRGFNGRGANKLLVLIDGREVYDFVFAGVFWESKDVMLEDVDRIEVVRGPGGTLWETNAVNGVINIITKSAKDTQGALITGGGGSEERGFGAARYGTKLSDGQYLRAYGKYNKRDNGFLPNGAADDDSWFGQGGFRFDNEFGTGDVLTVQGDGYDGNHGSAEDLSPLTGEEDTTGANALARWKHTFSDNSEIQLLTYYDYTKLVIDSLGRESRNTGTLDLQYRFSPGSAHRIVTGLHYRHSPDETDIQGPFVLVPPDKTDSLINAFAEDRVTLIDEKLFFTIGSKAGYNDYSGFEVQPTVRLSWLASERTFFWGAVSRAIRTPSRAEADIQGELLPGLPIEGSRGVQSETVLAYELGVRRQLSEKLFVDVATFFNHYDQLVTYGLNRVSNEAFGHTYGAEVSLRAQPYPWWAINVAYTYLDMELENEEGAQTRLLAGTGGVENSNPDHEASLQCNFDLGDKWQLDADVRYVDSLGALQVDSYIVADVRLGYLVTTDLELSVVGQNLFDKQHFEQGGPGVSATEVQSGVYGKVLWRF